MRTHTIAAVLCLVLLCGSQALAAGKLIVDQDHLVFGTITEGIVARKHVTLHNAGDEPVTIANVSTSCSCTTTRLERTVLAPGTSADLEIVYNTLKFPGKFEKYVYLQWGAEKEKALTITLLGDVTPIPMGVLTATPRKVVVEGMRVGEPKEVFLTIQNTGDAEMRVTRIVGRKSGVVFLDAADKGPLLLKPGQRVLVPVTLTADAAGNYVEYIIFHSDARNVTRDGYKVVLVGEAK